jgi:hypothetical protein
MKKAIYLLSVAALLVAAVIGTCEQASAQERYTYIKRNGRPKTIPINWKPDSLMPYKRYTVAFSPLHLINSGIKFDFEAELRRRQGEWLQTSLILYVSPPKEGGNYYRRYGNNRSRFNSGFDDYYRMWGVGTSFMFKKMLNRRGWYFITGIKFEYYHVEANSKGLFPYVEDGLTFWEDDIRLFEQSFFKPTLQFNMGRHFSISRECFFDLWVGLSYSYSIYDSSKAMQQTYGGNDTYTLFSGVDGFARRGVSPNGGFRFGVLLWKREEMN